MPIWSFNLKRTGWYLYEYMDEILLHTTMPLVADDTTLMEESEEELKSLLMMMKQENEKDGLKLKIQKTKIMASGPSLHDK